MRRLFVGVAAAVLLAMSEPCIACSCVPMDPPQRRDFADAIFTGQVIDIRSRWRLPLQEKAAQSLLNRRNVGPSSDDVAFRVERVYKGWVHETQWVAGQGYEASCGFTFRRGQTYTVFASLRAHGGFLETGTCTGVVDGAFDASSFGFTESRPPYPGTDTNEGHGYALWFLALAVPLSIASAFMLVRYLYRRFLEMARAKAGPSP